MKKILVLIMLMLPLAATLPVNAGTNDFYFEDFTADYYLTKNSDSGVSGLKVVEQFTAVFPTFNQNKGICRQIPYTNRNGTNITLRNLDRNNIVVLRNGLSENIYSIDKYDGHYEVCTGTDEYVLGKQVYTFEYEFENVITEFDNYQELYWDTNGNGWHQQFNNLTARLHFEDMDWWTGESWCYVGAFGEGGQERCSISKIEDGIQFSTTNLGVGENLTFDAELKQNSFKVLEPEKDYSLMILLSIIGIVCAVIIIRNIRKYVKSRVKEKYYKQYFIKPEYQPAKEYSIAEMAEIFIGIKKDVKVAIILNLTVQKKISIVKKEEKKPGSSRCEIIVNNLDGVREEDLTVLSILNGGMKPKASDKIEIKTRTASSTLVSLAKGFDRKVLSDLKKDGLAESSYKIGGNANSAIGNFIATLMVMAFFLQIGLVIFLDFAKGLLGASYGNFSGTIMVGSTYFLPLVAVMIIATILIRFFLKFKTEKYVHHTMKGLEMSRYMDGLKMYIKMAEAERIQLLQSIDGADTSPEGIVKLYEKLLPYAAIFGLEKSWMEEMQQYCKVQEIAEPDYLMSGITISELSRSMRTMATVANSSSTYISSSISSGGSYSSGSSGGGGGGFSGGGGGGGGGGGR